MSLWSWVTRSWHMETEESDRKVQEAENLRITAEQQRRKVEEITPRVDAAAEGLRKLRQDNHFGPMIDSILRGRQ